MHGCSSRNIFRHSTIRSCVDAFPGPVGRTKKGAMPRSSIMLSSRLPALRHVTSVGGFGIAPSVGVSSILSTSRSVLQRSHHRWLSRPLTNRQKRKSMFSLFLKGGSTHRNKPWTLSVRAVSSANWAGQTTRLRCRLSGSQNTKDASQETRYLR